MPELLSMKVALVYDRVNTWGGAERVLLALHEIWPDAPLYTSVYHPKGAPWASVFEVRTSFLQRVPFVKNHHELFPWLMPFAFESFSFDEFDIVISVTSAEAKGIITKPETKHICYCLTPTRYLWSGFDEYQKHPGMGVLGRIGAIALRKFGPTLQSWDLVASSRPDHYIAISQLVKERIERYYHRKVEKVIYPPVDLQTYHVSRITYHDNFFLTVSRLVGYKRIDILIDAFNELGLPLIIIGRGRAYGELKKRAKKNITFITQCLTDDKLGEYYQKCRAFVFAGEEDFGIAAGEALSSGKPVVCYKKSGMAEIVIDGKTGILYKEQSKESLIEALGRLKTMQYNANTCQKSVARLDTQMFQKHMKEAVSHL